MAISQKHFNRIKADFEKDRGWMLSLQFVNNQYLVKDYLSGFPNEMDFSFESKTISWNQFSFVQHEHNVFVIKTSLHTVGDLIFYDNLKESHRKEIALDVFVDVPCAYVPEGDFISYHEESVIVKTKELETITSFDQIVFNKYNLLSVLKPLDFAIYNQIWPFNIPGNDIQVFVSSYTYFSEIDNIYRQVRYSIALASTYAEYANRYYKEEVIQPFVHYPINFTSHDRRYLDFCTSAIHYMYVYWERLALLIFQYHQPHKVTSKNLSFTKLIAAISKEQMGTSIDLTWFNNFLSNGHSKIQQLRHPLVHYKLDPLNFQGSYIPMIHDRWLNDTRNKQQLLDMEANSKALIGDITKLAQQCQEGYEKALQLIVDLKSTPISVMSKPSVTTSKQP